MGTARVNSSAHPSCEDKQKKNENTDQLLPEKPSLFL